MKYCTHCGKELFDEAVMCPGCGAMVAAPEVPQKKVKERKPVDKKKAITITVIAIVSLLVIAGGIFGFLVYRNYSLTKELEEQLVGNTYEYKGTDYATGYDIVRWLSFTEGGEYRSETADFATEDVENVTGSYSVEVNSDGEAELWLDRFNDAFTIILDEAGEIEGLTSARDTYYPIERAPEYALLYWFEGELFNQNLAENKQLALEMFAETSFWNNGDSFDNLVPIIFKDYDLTCEPVGDSNEEFIIKLSGYYYINKVSLPTITEYGELTCRVWTDPLDGYVKIESDDGIVDAMDLYVILSTYGSYGW